MKFLVEDDWFALISCSNRGREILGILKFEGVSKIKPSALEKFQPLHQLSKSEVESFKNSVGSADCFYAWHVELVKQFDPPLKLQVVPGMQVWCWFPWDAIGHADDIPSQDEILV